MSLYVAMAVWFVVFVLWPVAHVFGPLVYVWALAQCACYVWLFRTSNELLLSAELARKATPYIAVALFLALIPAFFVEGGLAYYSTGGIGVWLVWLFISMNIFSIRKKRGGLQN